MNECITRADIGNAVLLGMLVWFVVTIVNTYMKD